MPLKNKWIVFLVLALLVFSACAREPERATRVIFVGIDAVDWKIAKPLVEAGKMPNLARIVEEGATGRLETFIPLEKSPILWTSIATGKRPEKHGIGGFLMTTEEGDTVPYTGNVRRVRAIWNILGERGYKVCVAGWLVTWPAEEVNGYMVSDYVQYETEHGIKVEDQTYPRELFDEIDSLRVLPSNVTDEEIAHLYPVDIPPESLDVAGWEKSYVKMIYALDETFRRISLYLFEKDQDIDFLAVYFNGIDSMCHMFWDRRKDPADPIGKIIDNYYIWMDEVLGEYMHLADERTLLVVCSDHGFHGPRHMRDGGILLGVYMHGRYGIVGFCGPGIKRGAKIIDAGLLDITPTILYALGFPVARDMDGHVLVDAFEEDFLRKHQIEYIPTYETKPWQAGKPRKSPVDEKIKKKLRGLGYIE